MSIVQRMLNNIAEFFGDKEHKMPDSILSADWEPLSPNDCSDICGVIAYRSSDATSLMSLADSYDKAASDIANTSDAMLKCAHHLENEARKERGEEPL